MSLNRPIFRPSRAERLVLVRADFPRMAKNQLSAEQTSRNELLAEKYNHQGKFPFTVLLDASGKVLQEWDGYPKSLTIASMTEQIQSKMPVTK